MNESSNNFQLARHYPSELPRNGAIECSSKYEPYELPTKHQLQSKWCLEQRQSRSTIAPIIQSLPISGSTTESIQRQWVSSPTEPEPPACKPRADLLPLRSSPVPTPDLLPLHLPLPHYYPCAEYTLNVHSQAKNMRCTEKLPIVRKR